MDGVYNVHMPDLDTSEYDQGTRPGLGTNQYRTKWSAQPHKVRCRSNGEMYGWWPDGQVLRCGDVWGTKCQAWVKPPEYTHGNHGRRPTGEASPQL